MDWAKVYTEAADDHAINEVFGAHEKFAVHIEQRIGRDPRAMLEVGVGTGAFLAAFALRGHPVIGIDSDPHIVDQVDWLIGAKGLDALAEALLVDAFAMPFQPDTFVAAYSQGTMEHFDDVELTALLHEQMRVAGWVIFSVPTPYWVDPPLVEPEYRRTEAEWVALLERLGFVVHFSFSYWNGMHAVIVLLSRDNPPPHDELDDTALEVPPAEEREPVIVLSIPEDESEPVHPVHPKRKAKRSKAS